MDKWRRLKHFTKYEFCDPVGNPNKMQPRFLLDLDNLRDDLQCKIRVNYATGGNHSINSMHYRGQAGDVTLEPDPDFKDGVPHFLDVVLHAAKRGLSVGYYPYWKGRDGKETGGFHFDNKEYQRFWLGVIVKGVQVYRPFDYNNLLDFNLIKG